MFNNLDHQKMRVILFFFNKSATNATAVTL